MKKQKQGLYVGIDGDDVLFKKPTLSEAEDKAKELIECGDCDCVTILCVSDVFIAELPPEEIVLGKVDPSELLDDEDD